MQAAASHAECCVCFEPLFSQQCGFFTAGNPSVRSCRHILHLECGSSTSGSQCPLCRTPFLNLVALPSAVQDPSAWFHAIDQNNNGSICYDEISIGLQACLDVNWRQIDRDADTLWSRWDHDGSGNISLDEFLRPDGILSYIREHYPTTPPRAIPVLKTDRRGWFAYWDQGVILLVLYFHRYVSPLSLDTHSVLYCYFDVDSFLIMPETKKTTVAV